MVEITPGGPGRRLPAFEQPHLLLSASQKDPAVVFVSHLHPEEVHIELSGPRHVLHVHHHVVDAGGLDPQSVVLHCEILRFRALCVDYFDMK